jgi:SAM-dependent methyltransferase
MEVLLCDGSRQNITTFDTEQLDQLHWEQERGYAQQILSAPSGSDERARAFRDGYDTVLQIIAQRRRATSESLSMGFNPRYVRLVLDLLKRQQRSGVAAPRLFEVGYAAGRMLAPIAEAGFAIAGIEVSDFMRQLACETLPQRFHDQLFLGDLLRFRLNSPEERFHVVYWNDVFEHLPPNESDAYLRKAFELLAPGGVLVTITPNWHFRPSDITKLFKPPRSTAEGFHLREYTLREMASSLRAAGFTRVDTPLIVTRQHEVLLGSGLCSLKQTCEPMLEYLPFRLTQLLCRGLGMSCTLAWKPRC